MSIYYIENENGTYLSEDGKRKFIKLEGEKAYEYLSSETKDTYFNTYDDFVNYVEDYPSITLKEFSSNNDVVGVIDNYGNEYMFDISYVWKYNVSIIVNE